MTSQVLTLVGQNGKQSIRREWERVQSKSHQINTTILKVRKTEKKLFIMFHCSNILRSNNSYKIVLRIG